MYPTGATIERRRPSLDSIAGILLEVRGRMIRLGGLLFAVVSARALVSYSEGLLSLLGPHNCIVDIRQCSSNTWMLFSHINTRASSSNRIQDLVKGFVIVVAVERRKVK